MLQDKEIAAIRRWRDASNAEWRVMAVADGWVMARRPRCAPVVIKASDWLVMCQPLETVNS